MMRGPVAWVALALAACQAAPGGGESVAAPFPETDAPGYAVLASQCSVCHAPPRPGRHTAEEWRRVVRRMQLHRVQRGMAAIRDGEVKALLDYLSRHARSAS